MFIKLWFQKRKAPLKFTIMRNSQLTHHPYSIILIKLNNFDTWKKANLWLRCLLRWWFLLFISYSTRKTHIIPRKICAFSLSLALIIRWTKEKRVNDTLFIVQGRSKEKRCQTHHLLWKPYKRRGINYKECLFSFLAESEFNKFIHLQ